MKKLLLAFLALPAIANTMLSAIDLRNFRSDDEYLEFIERLDPKNRARFNNPEYLKFVLGNPLDLHFYGAMTPGTAQLVTIKIHENLKNELATEQNYSEAGAALRQKPNSPDASIINACATIEQRLRKDGEAGIIQGEDELGWRTGGLFGFGSKNISFDGQRFFDNACPCDFYKKMTDEQLEQLRASTQSTK